MTSKKDLAVQLEKYKAFHDKIIQQQTITQDKDRLDIGFLHASPLIYKDRVIKTSPQLEFMQEAKTIKTAMKKTK